MSRVQQPGSDRRRGRKPALGRRALPGPALCAANGGFVREGVRNVWPPGCWGSSPRPSLLFSPCRSPLPWSFSSPRRFREARWTEGPRAGSSPAGRHGEGHRLKGLRVQWPLTAGGQYRRSVLRPGIRTGAPPSVGARVNSHESALGSTTRCSGLRWHRQTARVRVCSPSSRLLATLGPRFAGLTALTTAPRTLVRTGSCLSMPNRRPQDVAVDHQFRLVQFWMSVDTSPNIVFTAACGPPMFEESSAPS